MLCESCGKPLTEGAKFCESCGASVAGQVLAETSPKAVKSVRKKKKPTKMDVGRRISENIYLCSDGKYRWVYEFPMLKNPTIIITVWKVLGLSFGIVAAITFLISAFSGDLKYFRFDLSDLKYLLIFILVFLALSVIAYLTVASVYGWRYMVLFEMDENGVSHIQMKKQFEKAKALGWLMSMAGSSTGSPSLMGAGISTAIKYRSVSDFKIVKSVKGSRGRNTIYVNQLLEKNQVYVSDEDYDFVYGFIVEHCPSARVK
jgi:hypothetical protein